MTAPARLGSLRVARAPLARPPAIPLDEALERSAAERGQGPFVQGSLALDLVPDRVLFGPQSSSDPDLPDPRAWAHRLGLAIAEVLVGQRAPTQVVRWTTPEVYAVIARRALVAARRSRTDGRSGTDGRFRPGIPRARILVRRVHVCRPADGVAEASVILQDGPRVRAMALRLTGFDGRWRVESLEVG